MFEALRRMIADRFADPVDHTFATDDPRLAVAALLVHVAAVDGHIRPDEQNRLETLLGERYGLTGPQTRALLRTARAAELETATLQSFTAGLRRNLTLAERRDVIVALWQAALVDGVVQEFEDDVVWRIADLLDIAPHERIALRKAAEAALEDTTAGRSDPARPEPR